MAIFSKFFGAFIRHIIRLNAGTRMKPFSELFTDNFFGIAFVAFICTQIISNLSNDKGLEVNVVIPQIKIELHNSWQENGRKME